MTKPTALRFLYALFSFAIIAIGVLHMATTFRLSGTTAAKVWFFGAGIALVLAGVLNLLNRQYGLRAFGVRATTIATNVFMLCFAGIAARLTNASAGEQIFLLSVLASTLVLSAFRSASLGALTSQPGENR